MTESDVDLDDGHSGDVQFLDAIQQWLVGGRRRNNVGVEIVMRSDCETDEVKDLDGRFTGREDEREQTGDKIKLPISLKRMSFRQTDRGTDLSKLKRNFYLK